MIGLILVTAPNIIPGSLSINPPRAHAAPERSTDREYNNPSGTLFNGPGNSRQEELPHPRQQPIIIHWNATVQHIRYSYRK